MIKTVVFGGEHKDCFRCFQDSPPSDVFYCYCIVNPHYRLGMNGKLLSKKVLSYAPNWFLKKVYKKVFHWDFFDKIKKDDQLLFLCCSPFALLGDYIFFPFFESLKKLYPDSKFAFYSNDIVDRLESDFITIVELKKEFDAILTFDKSDAEKHGIEYYGDVNSAVPKDKIKKLEECDLFYCGGDAGRFDIQISVFKKASDMMLKNIFYIAGVSKENIAKLSRLLEGLEESKKNVYRYKDSILYINKYLPYEKIISYTISSKCILEVLGTGQHGSTLRRSEACIYNKKLLTNSADSKSHPSYDENNVMIFNNVKNIDNEKFIAFINSPCESVIYDFSPLKMVDYIKEKLYKEG